MFVGFPPVQEVRCTALQQPPCSGVGAVSGGVAMRGGAVCEPFTQEETPNE